MAKCARCYHPNSEAAQPVLVKSSLSRQGSLDTYITKELELTTIVTHLALGLRGKSSVDRGKSADWIKESVPLV